MKKQAAFILIVACGISARANMLQNPGFEAASSSGPAVALNWKMNEPDDHGDAWGSALRMDWRAHEGQYAAAVRGRWANAGDYGGVWQEAEVEHGRKYRFSAWLWADATWSASIQDLKIEFWDVGRSQKLGESKVSFNDISEMWMEKSVEGVAPEGAFWARVVITVSGAGPQGALQIDDLKLEESP
jgi:hypothetical protein